MPSKTKKVQKKRGRRVKSKKHHKTQKGGAYGNTMNSMTNNAKANLGFGYSGPVKYNHCGGSKGVAIFNNRVGYGYTNEGASMADSLQGSYAPVSRYVASQCGAGKRKHKKSSKSKSKKNKTRSNRTHIKRRKKGKKGKKHTKKRKTLKRKHKGKKIQKGGNGYSQFQSNTPFGSSFESPVVTPPNNALGPLSINKTNINCVDNYNHYKK